MRMNQGVEWAVHGCTLLAPLWPERGLNLAALASFHGVPGPYMAKQMQLLSKAEIVFTSRGKSGGYRLARAPSEISLWEIVCAVDGSTPMFRCTEIRQNGPCANRREDCRAACPIAAAFAQAEQAYRSALVGISLADILTQVGTNATPAHLAQVMGWIGGNMTALPGRQSAEPLRPQAT